MARSCQPTRSRRFTPRRRLRRPAARVYAAGHASAEDLPRRTGTTGTGADRSRDVHHTTEIRVGEVNVPTVRQVRPGARRAPIRTGVCMRIDDAVGDPDRVRTSRSSPRRPRGTWGARAVRRGTVSYQMVAVGHSCPYRRRQSIRCPAQIRRKQPEHRLGDSLDRHCSRRRVLPDSPPRGQEAQQLPSVRRTAVLPLTFAACVLVIAGVAATPGAGVGYPRRAGQHHRFPRCEAA